MDTKKLKRSFVYAWTGIKISFRDQQNLRLQVIIALVVIILALLLKVSILGFALLLVIISHVLSLELANSALEKYIDKLTPNEDPTIGIVKDILAGAVLVSAFSAVIIGIILFYRPFFDLIN